MTEVIRLGRLVYQGNSTQGIRKESQRLDKEVPGICTSLWVLKGSVPTGALERAFKSCRENPDWYLCTWLRQDCAGRGGCCGRDCGCCEKDESRGHCTSVCGSCIRTNGRSDDLDDMDCLRDMHGVSIDVTSNATYSRRILRAYIWGLSFMDELSLDNYWW